MGFVRWHRCSNNRITILLLNKWMQAKHPQVFFFWIKALKLCVWWIEPKSIAFFWPIYLEVAGNNLKSLSPWCLQLISIVLNLRGQILRDCKPSDLDNSFLSMHCAECLPGYNEQWACEIKSVRMQLFQRKFSDYLFILDLFLKWGKNHHHWDLFIFFESGFVKYSGLFRKPALMVSCVAQNKAGVSKINCMGDHLVALLDCTSPCDGSSVT